MSITATSAEDHEAWEAPGVFGLVDPPAPTSGSVRSPFAENTLQPPGRVGSQGGPDAYAAYLASPFTEAAGLQSDFELEGEAVQELLAELEDEEFSEAVDRLVQEGAARYSLSLSRWAGEADASAVAEAEVEQWLGTLAEDVDRRLAELGEHYGERTVESLSEVELESLGEDLVAPDDSPLDAQEDFFGKLWRKVKKVAKGVVKLAKKGVSALSRLLPMDRLLGAIRRLVRPLLSQVLGKAIGKLPAPLRPAARKLARRFGLEAEDEANQWTELLAEPASSGEELSAEFDQRLTGYLLAPGPAAAEGEIAEYEQQGEAGDPVGTLDDARRRLAEYFAEAEHQAEPTAQMEQFIPAVLPLVKLGVRIVGRKRVVGLVAKLIAQLIRPMVGRQLAPVLSRHIASSGLSLIGLEAESEADSPRLGADALVSVAEDTIREVFGADPEALEDELLTSGIVQEAFVDAATRHLPDAVLRAELLDEGEDERGVWITMPSHRHGPCRHRAYSRRVPIVLHRPMARQIFVGEDETLEDRLLEAGVDTFPVHAEVEAFETLPGGDRGHVVAAELEDEASVHDRAAELFELEDESRLAMALPAHVGRARPHGSLPRRRRPTRRYVRIRVGGVPLRRFSPVSLRLDVSQVHPILTVRVRVGERRSHEMAARLGKRDHIGVVGSFQSWVRGPLRRVMTMRLRRMLALRGITAPDAAVAAAASRVADAVARAFASEAVAAAPQLAAAAKDPRRGLTLTFALTYPSKAALLTAAPAKPRLAVSPGWRHG